VTGAELSRRTTKRLTPAIVLSNVGGALDVFYFLAFLLPVQGESDPERARIVNGIVLVAFLAVAVAVGCRTGVRIARPVTEWLESEQPPTAAVRRSVLRQPLWQMYVNGSIWLAAAVVFGLLNLTTSVHAGFDVALTIVLGGFTT
jgi:adenylate cyclase